MAGDKNEIEEESGYHEDSGFGEIEKEMGLDELLEDEHDMQSGPGDTPKRRARKMKRLKKVLFVLLLSIAGVAVLGVSLKLGQKIFVAYKTVDKGASQEEFIENRKEIPNVAIVPKADEPSVIAGEGRDSVKESPAARAVKPVSDQAAKGDHPVIGKERAQTTSPVLDSMAKPDRPATVAKPAITGQAPKPAARSSKVKPATKARQEAPAGKAAVEKAKAPRTSREYKVVVGSFSVKANADSLSNRLRALHYKPSVVLAMTPKGRLYRVIVGSYRSLPVAKAKMAELKKSGFQSFFILE